VSFVTSIATGIVTVSLMDQAPEPVTQTINRVVERTIEKVVPSETQKATVVTKETTVVVKEEDLITESIEKNGKSLVRISRVGHATSSPSGFVGMGVVVSRGGMVVTDASLLSSRVEHTYNATLVSNKTYPLQLVGVDEEHGLAILQISPEGDAQAASVGGTAEGAETEEKDTSKNVVFQPVVFADPSSLKLGQTVIGLGGEERTAVSMGIVSDLVTEEIVVPVGEPADSAQEQAEEGNSGEEVASAETTEVLAFIDTTIQDKDIILGAPLFNIFGELVALAVQASDITAPARHYVSVNRIQDSISAVADSADDTTKPTDANAKTEER
jgi:hypothetical protein